MAAEAPQPRRRRPLPARQKVLVAWLLGPTAWAIHLGLSYALIPWVCHSGHHWTLHAATLVTLAGALWATALGYWGWRAARPLRGDGRVSRLRFMAQGGIAISIASALIILAEGVPNFLVDACLG